MQLFELLTLQGPATSTSLAAQLGHNTGTVSWHLRHLEKHGFIVEDMGRGTKRERWWKRSDVVNEFATADLNDDPLSRAAFSLFVRQRVQQYFSRVLLYIDEDWSNDWREAGVVADRVDLRLSPAQLHELNGELMNVIDRYAHTTDAPAATNAQPVVIQIQSFPRSQNPLS